MARIGIAVFIGVALGVISGYYGGIIDEIIMRIVDMIFAIPLLVLTMAIVVAFGRGLDKVMWFFIIAGVVLSCMHQSSLGTVMLLAGPRLHGLWHTPWIPFLFLVSCIGMGYAVVVMESALSSRAFGRLREDKMLAYESTDNLPVEAGAVGFSDAARPIHNPELLRRAL